MHAAYLIVLIAATTAVVALIGYRAAQALRQPRQPRGRLLNEWAWTLIPLAVLALLLWRALTMAK